MSLFGRATFSAAGYAAARPTYPATLFRSVLAYRDAQCPKTSSLLLDVGCGHGVVAREMSAHFAKVVGIDTSAGMIKQASSMTDDANITFRQGGVEDLSFLRDGSVDMVVAGQSAHWFDYGKAWPELSRVVKPGGSLAFWGYKDNMLVGHPRANSLLDRFCYADGHVAPGIEGMRAYWEQPGRNKVRNLLREVEPPAAEWRDVRRILHDTAEAAEVETAWMRKRISLGHLEAYVRTFSAFQGWRDAHPEAKSRAERRAERRAEAAEAEAAADSAAGDLVDVLMDRIVETEPQWQAMGERWREAEVETVWGTYILLATRR